jgi:hypothetical protein
MSAQAAHAALVAALLWDAFKLQAAAHHWDNVSMLAAVATGKALPFSVLADLLYMAEKQQG